MTKKKAPKDETPFDADPAKSEPAPEDLPAAEWVNVTELRAWEGNPRKNAHAVPEIARAIEQYGFGAPIVARRANKEIIAGHTRFEAARALGMKKVPVRFMDLSEAEAHALSIADNKLGELAEWDDRMLIAQLDKLRTELPDFDAADVGLVQEDLDRLEKLAGTAPPANGEDPGAQPVESNAVSQRGEMYDLGPHRLFCGDSTSEEDVARLMHGEKADLCATDPPYLVDYTGADRPNGSGKDWSGIYKEIEITDAEGFFRGVFQNVLRFTKDNAAIYCWHAHKRHPMIARIWDELDILDHQQIVWVKPSALFGRSFWPYQHEPCVMGWRKGHKPDHDGDNSHAVTTVWHCDWDGKSRVVGNEHPTEKPTEIFGIPIRKHTKPGDLVFEPFSGSGSQLIAAAKEGRRCYGMEISPHFCDAIRRRWTKFAKSAGVTVGIGGLE